MKSPSINLACQSVLSPLIANKPFYSSDLGCFGTYLYHLAVTLFYETSNSSQLLSLGFQVKTLPWPHQLFTSTFVKLFISILDPRQCLLTSSGMKSPSINLACQSLLSPLIANKPFYSSDFGCFGTYLYHLAVTLFYETSNSSQLLSFGFQVKTLP